MFSKERHRLTIDLPPDHFVWSLPPKARSALVREYLSLGRQYDRILTELREINRKLDGSDISNHGSAVAREGGIDENKDGPKDNGVHMESLFGQF